MAASRRAISDRHQLRALASPVRQELVDLLARTGPTSAAELGALIGRPADGLYYHLRELQRVGLISPAGSRKRGRRREAIFRSAYREPSLVHDPSPQGNSPAVTTIIGSMLRLGARDFRKAVGLPRVRTHGPYRELWGLRVTGWLTPDEIVEVNRRIVSLQNAVARPRSRGKLYAITILLTPLEHRARKKQRRPRVPRANP